MPLPAFARPVINVTVPIQTLMGVTDDPGSLSGGDVIPATFARMIAMQPGSTWHRLLTDPRERPPGSVLERSTASYRPTRPIWLDVVARDGTCFRANCGTPSTNCELDHKVPYPHGATSTVNLHAACRTDHKAKHARGFGLGTGEDGSATFHTGAGFVHHIPPTEHPTGDDAAWSRMSDLLDEFSETGLSATEFLDTLEHLRRTTGRQAAREPMVAEIRRLRADYAAAYPDATDEEIDYWIFGDPFEDEENHFQPSLTAAADTTESVVPLRRVG